MDNSHSTIIRSAVAIEQQPNAIIIHRRSRTVLYTYTYRVRYSTGTRLPRPAHIYSAQRTGEKKKRKMYIIKVDARTHANLIYILCAAQSSRSWIYGRSRAEGGSVHHPEKGFDRC